MNDVDECRSPCDQCKSPEESHKVYQCIQQHIEQLKHGVKLTDQCPCCKASAMGTLRMIAHHYECKYKYKEYI